MNPLQALVRDVVAPVLRAHGFKRSAGTFRNVTPGGVAVLQVSGRGGIGLTDLDFHVDAGFTLNHDLRAPQRPEQVIVAPGASTWQDRIYDPAIGVPMGQKWLFNDDNSGAKKCFAEVLDQAAEDLMRRLESWPSVPQDSFGPSRRLRRPVDPGQRPEYQAWLTQAAASLRSAGLEVPVPSPDSVT